MIRDGFDGGDEHFVGEEAGAGEDDAESDAGEGCGVVAFGFVWSGMSVFGFFVTGFSYSLGVVCAYQLRIACHCIRQVEKGCLWRLVLCRWSSGRYL